MSYTLNNLARKIENRIFNDFGFELEITGDALSEKGADGAWIDLPEQRIPTSAIGPLGLVMERLKVRIKIGWYEITSQDRVVGVIDYDFRWESTEGGKNGLSRRIEIDV